MRWFRRDPPEQRFWDWFRSQSGRLLGLDFENLDHRLLDAVSKRLHRYHAGLSFEFGPTREAGREFIVSADGNRELFPVVEKLVAAAPELPGWQIMAFRPAKGTEMAIRFGPVSLSAHDIWYTARSDGYYFHLDLYVRGLITAETDGGLLPGAVMVLLDAALGEYVVETRVGDIEWHPLPDDPETRGLQPFPTLPALFGINDQAMQR